MCRTSLLPELIQRALPRTPPLECWNAVNRPTRTASTASWGATLLLASSCANLQKRATPSSLSRRRRMPSVVMPEATDSAPLRSVNGGCQRLSKSRQETVRTAPVDVSSDHTVSSFVRRQLLPMRSGGQRVLPSEQTLEPILHGVSQVKVNVQELSSLICPDSKHTVQQPKTLRIRIYKFK